MFSRDRIHKRLITKCEYQFTVPQVLESATWKVGRVTAEGGPPTRILSDGASTEVNLKKACNLRNI